MWAPLERLRYSWSTRVLRAVARLDGRVLQACVVCTKPLDTHNRASAEACLASLLGS